jgi:hypothetical protein
MNDEKKKDGWWDRAATISPLGTRKKRKKRKYLLSAWGRSSWTLMEMVPCD